MNDSLYFFQPKSNITAYSQRPLPLTVDLIIEERIATLKHLSEEDRNQTEDEHLPSARQLAQLTAIPAKELEDTGPIHINHWLYDDEVSNLLKKNDLTPNIQCLPPMSFIGAAPLDRQSLFIYQNLAELKRSLPDQGLASRLYIPLNLGNNHWVMWGCVVDPQNPNKAQLTYIDSLAVPHSIFNELRLWLYAIGKYLFPDIEMHDFTFEHRGQQNDGYSCGYITVKNIIDHAESGELSIARNANKALLTQLRMAYLTMIYPSREIVGRAEMSEGRVFRSHRLESFNLDNADLTLLRLNR